MEGSFIAQEVVIITTLYYIWINQRWMCSLLGSHEETIKTYINKLMMGSRKTDAIRKNDQTKIKQEKRNKKRGREIENSKW